MEERYRQLSLYLHPGSLAVAVLFDLLWSCPETGLTGSWAGIIFVPLTMGAVFSMTLAAVTLIQRYAAADEWATALKKGLLLGGLAAVPFSFVGLAFTAFWGIARARYGVNQDVLLLGRLTRSWREIEQILRRLAPPEMRGASIEDLINHLQSRRLLSAAQADRLHHLRRERNRNTHEHSTGQLEELVDEVQAMENELRVRFMRLL